MKKAVKMLKNTFYRVGIVSSVLVSLIALSLIFMPILSAISSHTLKNYSLDLNVDGPEHYHSVYAELPTTRLIETATAMSGTEHKQETTYLLSEIFNRPNGRNEVLLYLGELLHSSAPANSKTTPVNVSKFISTVKIITDYVPINEIMTEFLSDIFDSEYTNSFYYAYKCLIPLVDRSTVDEVLRDAEEEDKYLAYVIHSAVGDEESMRWCAEHELLNTEITELENGFCTQKILHYYDFGVLVSTIEQNAIYELNTEYEYNEKGLLVSERSFHLSSASGYLAHTVDYSYDSNGVMHTKTATEYNEDGTVFSTETTVFGSDGLEIRSTYSEKGSTTVNTYIYKHDDQGRLTEEQIAANGYVHSHVKYSYNNDDHPLLPSEIFDALTDTTYVLRYNGNGKVERMYQVISGQYTEDCLYVYDVFGNLRSLTITDNGKVSSTKLYDYTCHEIILRTEADNNDL